MMQRVALALCMFAWTPMALAQTVTPPPAFTAPDSEGVDSGTGLVDISAVDLTIGPAGQGGLSYARRYVDDAWRPNTVGTINSTGSSYIVSVGGNSETFTLASGVYTSDQAVGSTLTYDGGAQTFSYTLADGTILVFAEVYKNLGMPWDANVARLVSISSPDGSVTTYHYVTVTVSAVNYGRLQSVTNNHGYQLHLTYANNAPSGAGDIPNWMAVTTVRGINNAVDYCSPTAATCSSFTETWPVVTYTGSQLALATVTNALSETTTYTYSSGRLSAIRFPGSSTDNITYTYNVGGSVDTVSNGVGTWTYSYFANLGIQTTTIVDPNSNTTTRFTNQSTGQLTGVVTPAGNTYFQHDTYGRRTRVTADEGNYVEYTYDTRGNVTLTTWVAKSGSGLSNIITSASYPGSCSNPVTCNQPTSITDARGNITNFTYDSTHGGVLTATAPAVGGVSPEVRYTYQQGYPWYRTSASTTKVQGAPIYVLTQTSACATSASCSGSAEEQLALLGYQSGNASTGTNLLVVSSTSQSGNGAFVSTTTATYDPLGNVQTVDGPLSGSADTTWFAYDALRRPIGVISPDPDGAGGNPYPARRIGYNSYGMANSTEIGTATAQGSGALSAMTVLAQETGSYDAQTTWLMRGDAFYGGVRQSVVQYSYDAGGRLDCAAVRMNPAVFTSLPSSACTPSTTGANGPDRITKTNYDGANRVVSVISGYAVSGQQITDGVRAYTDNGQIDWIEDSEGNRTNYIYDGFDRLYRQEYPSTTVGAHAPNTSDYEQYGYDVGSNVTSRRLRSGETINFTYDVLNRQTVMDLPSTTSADVYYAYDLLNRLLSARYASTSGDGVVYSYATPGTVTETDTQASPDRTLTSVFDPRGLRTRLTHPDGNYFDYTYDVLGRSLEVRENGATSGAGLLASFTYDALGRRAGISRAGGSGASTSYTYDTDSRDWSLAQNFSGSTYDITYSFTANAAAQTLTRTPTNSTFDYTPPSSGVVGYTPNGLNQYSAVASVSFTYDGRGNLTSDGARTFAYDLLNRLASVSGSASMTLTYDPLGRLRQTVSSSTTTQFLYDGNNLVLEYDGSNAIQRRYAQAAGIDEPLVWYEGAGLSDRRWLVTDEQGSVAATANASGVVGAAYSYSTFGEPGGGTWTGSRFRYTGQIGLPDIGLYHYKTRVYDPSVGRFLQVDPIGYAGGLNLYAYVANDPSNSTDPLGLRNCQRTTGSRICGGNASTVIYCVGDCSEYHSSYARAGNEMSLGNSEGSSSPFGETMHYDRCTLSADCIIVTQYVRTSSEFEAILEFLASFAQAYGPAIDVQTTLLGYVPEIGGVIGRINGRIVYSRVYTGRETGYPQSGINLGYVARDFLQLHPGATVLYDWHFHASEGLGGVAWEGFSSYDVQTTGGGRYLTGSFLLTPSSVWYVSRLDASQGYGGRRLRSW